MPLFRHFYAKSSKRLAENLDAESILFGKEFVSKVTRQGYGGTSQYS